MKETGNFVIRISSLVNDMLYIFTQMSDFEWIFR